MRYCTDSWFFHQLMNKAPQALGILRRCRDGKDQLIVPVVVMTEIRARAIRIGTPGMAQELFEGLQSLKKASLVPIDTGIAWLAGELRGTFNTPTVDALIAATAIAHKCHALLSGDGHFEILHKQGRLKVRSW